MNKSVALQQLSKVDPALALVLADAGMKPSDIHSVEIVGGGSRIKGVKQRISKVMELKADETNFGVSTTMNADEAVARGCALMCAMRLALLFRYIVDGKCPFSAAIAIHMAPLRQEAASGPRPTLRYQK